MKQPNSKDKKIKMPSMIPDDYHIENLLGRFQVTTTVPDGVPKEFSQQMVLYVDSISSPTVYRLYFYFPSKVNSWHYVALT